MIKYPYCCLKQEQDILHTKCIKYWRIIFSYDQIGNRIRKVIVGGSDTYYIKGYDGKTEAVCLNPQANRYNLNIYGNDLIGQLSVSYSTPTRYYYIKDHLGSIRVRVNSAGNVDATNDYYPFGAISRSTANAADTRYKFTGKERDIEIRYDYFGARYYDSRIARWLQVDPLADKYAGWSGYNYGLNNPINFIDPDGMAAVPAKPEEDDGSKSKKQNGTGSSNSTGSSKTENASAVPLPLPTPVPIPLFAPPMSLEQANRQGKAIRDALHVNEGIDILNSINEEVEEIQTAIFLGLTYLYAEHTKNARPSTVGGHQEGETRKLKDQGGEKGDNKRRYPRKRPQDWDGPYPPKATTKF